MDKPMDQHGKDSVVEKLEKRLEKLEDQRWEKWAQSAIVPVVLLLLGAWVNDTLQQGNKDLEKTRVASQQVDVAQKMLAGMFAGNQTKDWATARLMRTVVDSPMAKQVDSVLVAYYADRYHTEVQAGLHGGQPERLDSALAIVATAQALGDSTSRTQLTSAIGTSDSISVQRHIDKADSVRALEKSGFAALGSGDIISAHEAFRRAEELYPGYRFSYEMERLLNRARRDPSQSTAVLREAIQRFGQYMPADVIVALRTRVEGRLGGVSQRE